MLLNDIYRTFITFDKIREINVKQSTSHYSLFLMTMQNHHGYQQDSLVKLLVITSNLFVQSEANDVRSCQLQDCFLCSLSSLLLNHILVN